MVVIGFARGVVLIWVCQDAVVREESGYGCKCKGY